MVVTLAGNSGAGGAASMAQEKFAVQLSADDAIAIGWVNSTSAILHILLSAVTVRHG